MQRSKKILLTIAGILLALFVSSLMVLRNDVQTINEQEELNNALTQVPIENFEFLHFSGMWDVSVRQGRVRKMEVMFDNQNRYLPIMESIGDTLYFSIHGDSTFQVKAKLITPFLKSVTALGGATVRLKNFNLDSMMIVLDSSAFISEENTIIYTSYKTTGHSRVEFIDDPFK